MCGDAAVFKAEECAAVNYPLSKDGTQTLETLIIADI
jgi:hypothetical protein